MFRNRSVKSGFTIVELLVVIVVIGILAAISVVSYNGITQKAKQQVALTDATNVKKALDMKSIEGNLSSCFNLDGNLNTNCVSINGGTTVGGGFDDNSYELDITNGYVYKIKNGNSAPILLDQNKTVKFDYTGSIVYWTVPTGVTNINITTKGAQGGYVNYEVEVFDPNTGEWLGYENKSTIGGKGAYISADFAITPGQVLSILVGQQPDSPANNYGYSFPGGGGGTFVALGANYTTATPLLVAGGGGAAGSGGYWNGNDDTGQGGLVANINSSGDGGGNNPGIDGNGAPSAECGGGGGGFYTSGGNDTMYYDGLNGFEYVGVGAGGFGFRQGGAGGRIVDNINEWVFNAYQPGGFGGGSIADYIGYCNTTAGSGGGYSGGSSGSSGSGGNWTNIGKGGGSYVLSTSTVNQFSVANNNEGNGQVVINWQ